MKLFKNWKKLIRMIAIILLIITVFNFLCSTGLPAYAAGEVTYSTGNDILSGIADGIVGFLTMPIRMLIVLLGGAIDVLTGLFVGDGEDVDVETILFNNLDLTSVNFFKTGGTNEVVKALRENVALWYTAMRNIALAFLVVICLYVGIRMALSTAADEKAQYKRMLMDWVTSLALVFVVHYIMVAIIQFNNILVKAIEGANIKGESVAEMSDSFRSNAFSIFFIKGTSSAVVYFMLQLMTITILLMYVKRMITVAFLMMLSPLVSITYSIDKMGDGKAQALNTWLKEFAYTILIQPFHCLAFAVLGGIAKDMVESGGGHDLMAGVFTILLITFILQSEKIVKKIFHFESSSLQDVLASAAIASSLMDKSRGFAKKTAGAANAAKELKGNMPMIKERLKNKDSNNNNNEQKQLPKEKPKKKKEKPIDYSQLTETEKKAKIKELQDKKLRLQTGATKKELALRAFLGANKIGLSTALGMGIGGATGSDQAMLTKGFQDFTNSATDAMKKGREFSKGRLKHEVAKSYNTAREGVMAEIKQQYITSGKGKGKNEQEQQKDLEKIFDARMKDLLNGKTDIDSLGDEEKELAKLLNEMKGTLIIEGHKSNDAIDGCLSLLKEIEAGEVSEVWSGEGAGAVPTYLLGDLSHKRNIEREIEQLKVEYNQFTDSTDKFPEVVPDEHEKLNPGDK